MATEVNANPTKELFISMLTRDIDIRAAILEYRLLEYPKIAIKATKNHTK